MSNLFQTSVGTFPYRRPLFVFILAFLEQLVPLLVCGYLLRWTVILPWYLALLAKIILCLVCIYKGINCLGYLFIFYLEKKKKPSIVLDENAITIDEDLFSQVTIPFEAITDLTVIFDDEGHDIEGIEIEHIADAESPFYINGHMLAANDLATTWTTLFTVHAMQRMTVEHKQETVASARRKKRKKVKRRNIEKNAS